MDNYKIAIIKGQNTVDVDNENGKIEYIGNIDDGCMHIHLLIEYCKKVYPSLPIFKRLTEKHQPEMVAYFLTQLNHIVFLNITSRKSETKTGLLMLPQYENISARQKKSLALFCDEIEDYSLDIMFDSYLDEGILQSREIYSNEGKTPKEMLKVYERQVKQENKSSKSR